MRYDFATPEPPKLRFGIGAGRVEVETADVAETTVEVEAIRGNVEDLKVEQHSRDIVIEGRKRFGFKGDEYDIRVRTPYGSEVDANIASATFRAAGRLGAVEVNTASGDVQVEDVERDAKVRSASGDVQLGSVGGRSDVNTASGDVQVGSATGGGTIRSASGDVQIGEAARRVSLNTASGDMQIASIAEGVRRRQVRVGGRPHRRQARVSPLRRREVPQRATRPPRSSSGASRSPPAARWSRSRARR